MSKAPLLCPHCGFNYLHHEDGPVDVWQRHEDDEKSEGVRVLPAGYKKKTLPANPAENPSARRDGIRIHLKCEGCGDTCALTIVQHKGTTFLQMEPKGEVPTKPVWVHEAEMP